MAKSDFLFDPLSLDFDRPIADIEAIREINPQRGDMEHLTAILAEDVQQKKLSLIHI